eukprot:403339373
MDERINQYLKQSGLDILLNLAFYDLIEQKPNNPIKHLSEYLQQRSHLYENAVSQKFFENGNSSSVGCDEEEVKEQSQISQVDINSDQLEPTLNIQVPVDTYSQDPLPKVEVQNSEPKTYKKPIVYNKRAMKRLELREQKIQQKNNMELNQIQKEQESSQDLRISDIIEDPLSNGIKLTLDNDDIKQQTISLQPLFGQLGKNIVTSNAKSRFGNMNLNKIEEKNEDDYDESQELEDPSIYECDPTEALDAGIDKNYMKQKYIEKTIQSDSTQDSTLQTSQFDISSSQTIKIDDYKIIHVKDINELFEVSNHVSPYYVQTQSGFKIILSENIHNFKNQYDNPQDIINRATSQQTVISGFKNKDIDIASEGKIMEFLRKFSNNYKKIIGINEIGRGGEAIVYKVEHQQFDEIVAKCAIIKNENSQYALMKIMGESQQLKLLGNPMYVAQVKEEVVLFDKQSNQVTQYLSVVERAQNSLHDLLKIWNDQEDSRKFVEYYNPHKLTYYFFQILKIVEYLNQRDFYYGDMKPQNLLVFRNQLIKVGDLGISIKGSPDIPKDKAFYRLKGYTQAYVTLDTISKFRKQKKLSFNELIEYDRYALIQTMQRCIICVKDLHQRQYNGHQQHYFEMYNDLQEMSILKVIQKWNDHFNSEFYFSLAQVMKKEGKIESLQHIYKMTKFQNIIQIELIDIYEEFMAAQESKKNQLPQKYDDISLESQPEIQFQKQPQIQLLRDQSIQNLQDSKKYKIIVTDLLGSWIVDNQEKKNHIINYHKFLQTHDMYFFIKQEDIEFLQQLAISNSERESEKFNLCLDNVILYLKWLNLVTELIYIWEYVYKKFQFIEFLNLSKKEKLNEVEYKLHFINRYSYTKTLCLEINKNQAFDQLPEILTQLDTNLGLKLRLIISECYNIFHKNYKNLGTQLIFTNFKEKSQQLINQSQQKYLKEMKQLDNDDMEFMPLFIIKEKLIELQLLLEKDTKEVYIQSKKAIDDYKNFLGDSHSYILELFGINAKSLYFNQDLDDQSKYVVAQYFYKYSKLSQNAFKDIHDFQSKAKNNLKVSDIQQTVEIPKTMIQDKEIELGQIYQKLNEQNKQKFEVQNQMEQKILEQKIIEQQILEQNQIQDSLEEQKHEKDSDDEYSCEVTVAQIGANNFLANRNIQKYETNFYDEVSEKEVSSKEMSIHTQDSQEIQMQAVNMFDQKIEKQEGNKLIVKQLKMIQVQDFDQTICYSHMRCPFFVQKKNCILMADLLINYRQLYDANYKELLTQATQYQNVVAVNNENETLCNEESLIKENIIEILQKYSKFYNCITDIQMIARGGEAIVYRLLGDNLEEEIIAKCTLNKQNEQRDVTQHDIFMDFLMESQQLKVLSQSKYIAQVKEEIILFDSETNSIRQYVVIVERAQFTLYDLLKIWKDDNYSQRINDYYHPLKLTFYFIQILQVMEYLHESDFYYGDMKPQNILIFQDQSLKIGDLGISFKFSGEQSLEQQNFKLKGITASYASRDTYKRFMNRQQFTHKQLIEIDRYALVMTFLKCVNDTKQIHYDQFKDFPMPYVEILQDLNNGKSISETLKEWKNFFNSYPKFALDLSQVFQSEGKMEALIDVYKLSCFQNLINKEIMPIFNEFSQQHTQVERQELQQAIKQSQLPHIFKYEHEILENDDALLIHKINKESNLNNLDNETILENNQYKLIIIDILSNQNLNMQVLSTKHLEGEIKEIVNGFQAFFTIKVDDLTYFEEILIQHSLDNNQRIELALDHFILNLKWYLLVKPLNKEFWIKTTAQFERLNSIKFDHKKLSKIKNILTYQQIILAEPSIDQLDSIYFMLNSLTCDYHLIKRATEKSIELFEQFPNNNIENFRKLQDIIKLAEIKVQEMKQKKNQYEESDDTCYDHFVEIKPHFRLKAFIIQLKNSQEEFDHEKLAECKKAENDWQNFLGINHYLLLELNGAIAKQIMKSPLMNNDPSVVESRDRYFKRYSRTSLESLIEYLEFCKETKQHEELEDGIIRFIAQISEEFKQTWTHILESTYTQRKTEIDKECLIDLRRYLESELKNTQTGNHSKFQLQFKLIQQFVEGTDIGSFTHDFQEKIELVKILIELVDEKIDTFK